MANNDYQNLWLHNDISNNEEKFNIAPYTSVDNIKIYNNGKFLNFADNYSKLKQKQSDNEHHVNKNPETNVYEDGSLGRAIENFPKILYGMAEPNISDGKEGDTYVQHGDNKIKKIWIKTRNGWVS